MAFPSGANGLVPWMNARPPGSLTWPTTVVFDENTSVVFKWIEDGTYTGSSIRIFAHGNWNEASVTHTVIAVAVDTYPVSPDHTVADRTALQAVTPTGGETALVSSDSSYWIAEGGRWVRTLEWVNAGTVNAFDITADVKTITVPMADIPELNGDGLVAGRYYNICLEENGLHYSGGEGYDAIFALRPLQPEQGRTVDRCELCGIRVRIPRKQYYWPSGKPKCIMQSKGLTK